VQFQFATIAAAGIHMTDAQGAPQPMQDVVVQTHALPQRLIGGWRRL
jgi:hypothetical protein